MVRKVYQEEKYKERRGCVIRDQCILVGHQEHFQKIRSIIWQFGLTRERGAPLFKSFRNR